MEKKNAPAAVASEPVASEPVASAPVAAEPVAAEPVAAEPVAAERVASEGGASKRGSSVNWASLSADGPLHKIGECLLANEEYADTYSAMRQVCRNWRSGLPEPDVHLDEWIMLDHALPHVAEFTFLQLGTSRYVTIDLSEVHTRYYFVGFCRGVIVLAQKNPPHKIRLLNPLTKKSNTMFEAQMPSVFLKSVAVIKSPTMVFVTAHYPSEIGWVDESTPTKDIDKDWEKRFSIKNHCLRCITPFNGELYALAVDNLEHGRIVCTNVQLQQRASTVKMETLISFPELGHQKFYLVKSDGDLLLVLLVSVALAGRPLVYRVDTQSRSLHPVSNIGSNAFFVNYIRCISVDTRVYPTLRPGCIYYTDLGYIREYSHDTKAWDEWAVRVDRIGNYEKLAEVNERADTLAQKLEQSEEARKKAESDAVQARREADKAKADAAGVEDLRKRLHDAETSLSEHITAQIAREEAITKRLRTQNRRFVNKTSQEFELEDPDNDPLLDAVSFLEFHGTEAREGIDEARTGLSRLFPYFFPKKEEPATFLALAKCFNPPEDLGLKMRHENMKVAVESTVALVADSQQTIDWAKVGNTEQIEQAKWRSLIKAAKLNTKKILAYLGIKPSSTPSSSRPEV
ncbi:hypothetical protein QYE76_029821 [Lolium multiflorum]|uniref:KIB1-4 beta-propeller domain-containing protein n=1 Tax=Lolium multiflorum TaxID=4521 RepID=A0AAD8QS70_LOLMU|nr:hypothetical protein QYE76_029821 [Lolium multiflorum]